MTLNLRPRIALFMMLAGLLTLTGCGTAHATTSAPPQAAPSQSAQARRPIRIISVADLIEPMSPEQMCKPLPYGSYLVAEVTVQSHGVGFWNTSDGLSPLGLTQSEIEQQGYQIYTPVTFSQMQTLRDARTTSTKRFLTMGGHTAQDWDDIDGVPQLSTANGHYIIVASEVTPPMRLGGPETVLVDIEYPINAQDMVLFPTKIAYPLATVKQALAACK